MLFQSSLGIDIQDQSASFVCLKASFKGFQVAAHAVYPLENGVSLQEKTDRIAELLSDFIKENAISPATIFLGIPRHEAILTYVQIPLAVKENLRESLGYEIEKYIPLSEDDVYFDYQVVVEDKESGKLDLLLVAARREAIDSLLELGAMAGVGISGIEIDSTAVANYFSYRYHTDREDTCVVVYLRNGRLEVDLLERGLPVYSRSFSSNEEYRDGNIVSRITRELNRLRERSKKQEGGLTVVFSGLESADEISEYFKGDEGFDIRFLDLSVIGTPSVDMISAHALALKGMCSLKTDINLLPRHLRKRPSKAGQYTMVALAALLILSFMGWGGGIIASKQLYMRELDKKITQLSVDVANIERTQKASKEIEAQIDHLNALYKARTPVLEALKELTIRVPKTAWVRRLMLSDKSITVDGLADGSAELISSLDGSTLFSDVSFLSSISRRDASGKETFRIGLKIQ